jgi:hypothetical protein
MSAAGAGLAFDSSCDAEDSPHRIQRSCFCEPLRFDLLVDDCLLVELKAVELLHPSSKAQLFSYMKLLDIPIGLLINFHEPILKNGILRMILPGANQREGGDDNKVSL